MDNLNYIGSSMGDDTHSQMLFAGFDDTDSPAGMCTTYLAYVIAGRLHKNDSRVHASFADYPRLVRLNPNVPWKTRGNGAVAMLLRTDDPAPLKAMITDAVFEHADTANGANPGLVFFQGSTIPDTLGDFAKLALWQLIRRSDARRLAEKLNLEYHYMGNGQGLVGAMGAIGYAWQDHTLELLSYRSPEMCGTPRMISEQSIRRMHERTAPDTYNSYDQKKGRVLIAPRGPDPVFYGIRGERIGSLVDASKMVYSDEKPLGYMIFRTNQGTNAHLENRLAVNTMLPHISGWIKGAITAAPVQGKRGGHVYFEVCTSHADTSCIMQQTTKNSKAKRCDSCISCAVYRPTGLARIAGALVAGDIVRIGGGVRRASRQKGRVLNAEYIEIISLARDIKLENPACHTCGKRMKSKGAGQRFECARCTDSWAPSKVPRESPRTINAALYIPDAAAQRHLTRPKQRLARRNRILSFDPAAPWLHHTKG